MWIVLEGAGELFYDFDKTVLAAGDAVYFEPFHGHRIFNNSAAALRMLSFWWSPK
jgi:uncharacterized cupin superfamily protein